MTDLLSHFHLAQSPFTLSPDPDFLYFTERHKKALAKCYDTIDRRLGVMLLHGDIGLGKTTLSRHIYNQYTSDAEYVVATLLSASYTSEYDFLNTIRQEFAVTQEGQDVAELRDILQAFLSNAYEAGTTPILILDEAQNLPLAMFEALRNLLNFETDDQKLLQIFLIAQQEILPLLDGMRSFADRFIYRVKLDALNHEESRELIAHRWKRAGGGTFPFSEPALAEVIRLAKGNPRAMCKLCNDALTNAKIADRTDVQVRDVQEAAIDHGLTDEEEMPPAEQSHAAPLVTAADHPTRPEDDHGSPSFPHFTV